MPANTPRGYPYSLPADPADVPGAIQDLAEAIDPDMQARVDDIHRRPTFRLSANTPVVFSAFVGFLQVKQLPFEVVDVNVEGAIPAISGGVGRIVPQLPGFWWFQAAMTIPRAGATFMDTITISMQTATQVLTRNTTHLAPPVSDGANLLTVTAGTFFNGTTDYIEVMGQAHSITPTANVPSLTIRNRFLLGRRMTES